MQGSDREEGTCMSELSRLLVLRAFGVKRVQDVRRAAIFGAC